jgi:hypothetical protein
MRPSAARATTSETMTNASSASPVSAGKSAASAHSPSVVTWGAGQGERAIACVGCEEEGADGDVHGGDEGDGDDEGEEGLVVFVADAVVEPAAVVVEVGDALVADPAVLAAVVDDAAAMVAIHLLLNRLAVNRRDVRVRAHRECAHQIEGRSTSGEEEEHLLDESAQNLRTARMGYRASWARSGTYPRTKESSMYANSTQDTGCSTSNGRWYPCRRGGSLAESIVVTQLMHKRNALKVTIKRK